MTKNLLLLLILGNLSSAAFSQEAEEIDLSVKDKSLDEFNYPQAMLIFSSQNKVKDSEEILWELMDPNYREIKSNEFQYQKIKQSKIDEMTVMINDAKKSNSDFKYNVDIEFGTYDLKEESFPLIKMTKGFELAVMREKTNLLKEDLLEISQINFKSRKIDLPEKLEIQFIGFEKMPKAKVSKDIAEQMVNSFGLTRSLPCEVIFNNAEVKRSDKKFGNFVDKVFKAKLKFKSGKCYFDNNKEKIAFNF